VVNCLYYCDWYEQYTADLVLAVAAGPHAASLIVREQAPEFTWQGRPQDGDDVRRRLRAGVRNFQILGGGYWSPRSLAEIHRMVRQSHADLFHLQQTGDPRFLWTAFRMPTVLTLHEPFSRPGLHRKLNGRRVAVDAVTWAYRRFANLIVVHTETGYRSLSPMEKRKAVVIPHGVKITAVDTPSDSKTILFFGRADGYKGLGTLLAAMETVWKSVPDARLRILASRGEFQHQVSDDRVTATWIDYSDAELHTALSHARAVCLPYTTVSGSGVGAQAYGAGKPIVASNLEGLRELVSHKELLVKPGEVEDLARALLLVLVRDYGAQPIDPERTWPAVARAHLSAYQEMLSRTKKRPLR